MREKSQTIVGKSDAGLRDILFQENGLGVVKKIYTGVGSRKRLPPSFRLSRNWRGHWQLKVGLFAVGEHLDRIALLKMAVTMLTV